MGSINKIAVIYGGTSSEREISLLSGDGVHKALIELGYESDLIDYKNISNIKDLKIYDFVFIALHGFEGENGDLQKDLDNLGISYSGSKSQACKLTWNKKYTKEILEHAAVNTPKMIAFSKFPDSLRKDFLWLSSFDAFRRENYVVDQTGADPGFEYIFLKPQEDGSSVDIFKISDFNSLKEAYQKCTNRNRGFIFEEFIDGKEFTVTIVNGECFPPIQIISKNEFYDYDAKYISNDTVLAEAKLSDIELGRIKKISIDAFNILGCKAWGRVDLMQCNKTGEFYVIEINTVPGMTNHSCVPKSGSFLGLSYNEVVKRIIDASI